MTIRLLLLSATVPTVVACEYRSEPANSATTESAATADPAAAIAHLYAAGGAVMPPNGPIGNGHAEIEKTWAEMMTAPGFDLNFTPDRIVISDAGDMALDRGTDRLSMQPDGTSVSDTGKYVVVWRKVDGQWKAAADIFNSDLPAGG